VRELASLGPTQEGDQNRHDERRLKTVPQANEEAGKEHGGLPTSVWISLVKLLQIVDFRQAGDGRHGRIGTVET
jgi:hypothetical protein